MPDTVRTLADLLTQLFQDGQSAGSISPQDMRDFVVTASAWAGIGPTVTTATAAGTTQGTATALTSYTTIVTSVPDGTGVRLDSTQLVVHRVVNRGTLPLLVYPPTGVNIENLATNIPITLAVGSTVEAVLTSSSQAYLIGGFYPPAVRLPTSSYGLGTGNIWRNGTVVNIVP